MVVSPQPFTLPLTQLFLGIFIAQTLSLTPVSYMVISGMLSITVSIGVGQADPAIDTPESILHTADQALYLAKDAGRNQVCLGPMPAQATKMMGNGSGRTGVAPF